MNPAYLQVSSQIWSDEERVENSHAGIYVAVSGNTGSGKSALIDAVVRLAQQRNIPVIGVNEREIHHPYLRLMFSDPGSFAFPIQVNFLLQRYLVLLRHLKLGHVVIIERSHLDDEMFVREHVDAGIISAKQYAAYQLLAEVLHEAMPLPDIMVLLHASPDLSLKRIRQSESSKERPEEFPNESAKEQWVKRWYRLYTEFHENIRRRSKTNVAFGRVALLEREASVPTEEVATQILAMIESRRERESG